MRIYLNRFLNVPPAKIPKPKLTVAFGKGKSSDDNDDNVNSPEQAARTLLNALPEVLDKQQQTNQAGQLVSDYLYNGGSFRPDFGFTWESFTARRSELSFYSDG